MRRFLFALLLIGVAVVAAVPVAAGDVPPVCTPDPRLTLNQSGSESSLYFEPRIHVLCPLWDDAYMDYEAELYAVQMTVIVEQKFGDNWIAGIAFDELLNATEISNLGGTYYNLNGGVDITGQTTPNFRYRFVVAVSGLISNDPGYSGGTGSADDAFGLSYFTPWIYGPDGFEVNEPFRERPDELKDQQRQTHSPATGLQSN